MVPAAQGSLSRHAVQEDRRCHAVLPNLGDRGDRQDPVGRQRQGIRPGGVVAQHRTSMEGGAPQKTYRGAVLAGFTFLARGAGRALETGVTSTARGTGITTSTLGTIFASRAGGTGGAWVTLWGEKMGLVQMEAAFPPLSPASWHHLGLWAGSCT